MKFYNRKEELEILEKIVSSKKSEFCYFLGRRRIGKTSLIKHFFKKKNKEYIYFFVGNKSEGNLLKNFSETLEKFLGFNVNFSNLREFLKFIFDYSKKNPDLNIVFDEFQNFQFVNKEIFSDFQEFWDENKNDVKINIFAIGSIFTLMEKVFQNKGSPLFGRATAKIFIDEFEINILKEILEDYNIFSNQNLLDIYTLFGGIPKYLEVFDDINGNKKLNKKQNKNLLENILKNHYISKNSIFLNEGKDLLISEFGKTYQINFSILEAIANGKTKRSEIADYTKINYDSLGLYLDKLEKYYKYIEKINPVISQNVKINKYKIRDNFLTFWFRYIYKKSNLIEIGKYDELIDFIKDDIKILQGFVFEKLVKKLIIQKNINNEFLINFDKIGNYFDRKGQNEIDLVCFNDKNKEVLFIECKLNNVKLNEKIKKGLVEKSETIIKFKTYKKHYLYLGLDNIGDFL